jgi:protein FAM32A|eukprot:scaffold3797_cov267-Chaetoceros_neogracile.AAC.18
MAPTFLGGKLKLKGKKKKKSKHEKTSKRLEHETDEKPLHDSENDDDDLTDAERKSMKLKMDRKKQEIGVIAKQSHRERVEEFNEKLGNLTELNDIPRVSAAGNG